MIMFISMMLIMKTKFDEDDGADVDDEHDDADGDDDEENGDSGDGG